MTKLEVYPAYAEQLNVIVRSDRTKRGIWGDVVKRAADLIRRENGERICYPQRPVFFPGGDPDVQSAQVTIARVSQRARWVYLSIAAREILQRERRILPVLLVLVLASILVAGAADAGSSSVSLSITPQQVNRFDSFLLTITTSQPNTTFNVSITGTNGFYVGFENRTDARGIFVQNLSAYYAFGQYEIRVSIANATARAFVTIGCDASCEQEILNGWGLRIAQLVYGELEKWGLYVLLGVLFLETPRVVSYFRRWAKYARDHGDYTPSDQAAAPVVLMRGHINPADNVADPRNPQNPRILEDMRRRRLTEQLHDATSKRFLGWHPDHIENLDELMRDLRGSYARQKEMDPEPSLIARKWNRPPEPETSPLEKTAAPVPAVVELAPKSLQEMYRDSPDPRVAAAIREIPPPPSRENTMHVEMTARLAAIIRARKRSPARAWTWALVASAALGVPMAVLVAAAHAGLYVDALRGLWIPFPPDEWKILIGFAIPGACAIALIRNRSREA